MNNFRNPYVTDLLDYITRNWLLVLLALSPIVGVTAGMAIADPIAERADRQHNLTVIATTEMAAKNYSAVPTGDANLRDPNKSYVPMFDLDESYR